MAATGKSTTGSGPAAEAGGARPAQGAKVEEAARPKEGAKTMAAARRSEPDLEALERGRPADVDRLDIARTGKWRGRCAKCMADHATLQHPFIIVAWWAAWASGILPSY